MNVDSDLYNLPFRVMASVVPEYYKNRSISYIFIGHGYLCHIENYMMPNIANARE